MTEPSHFSVNLRHLCARRGSISAACREIGINRQQFNKYLSGAARPASHNLYRICDYFGLDDWELALPHEVFLERQGRQRASALGESHLGLPGDYLDEVYLKSAGELARYLSYYHTYFYSLAHRGLITRSLVKIHENHGRIYSKGLELIRREGEGIRHASRYRYIGTVAFLHDRIYIREHEVLVKSTISQTILVPSYRSRIEQLDGLTLGVPSGATRLPACSRVCYVHLGSTPDLRSAIEKCGRFAPDSPSIPPEIEKRVRNTLPPTEHVLFAAAE